MLDSGNARAQVTSLMGHNGKPSILWLRTQKNSATVMNCFQIAVTAAGKGGLPLCYGSAASAVGFVELSVLRPSSRSMQTVLALVEVIWLDIMHLLRGLCW